MQPQTDHNIAIVLPACISQCQRRDLNPQTHNYESNDLPLSCRLCIRLNECCSKVLNHRYPKKNRLLKFLMCLLLALPYSKGIFVVATNSTEKTDKAGSVCH